MRASFGFAGRYPRCASRARRAATRSVLRLSSSSSSRSWGENTVCVHGGEEVGDAATKASTPPIQMSTTFGVTSTRGFSAHDQDPDQEKAYVYTRWGNPTIDQLQDKLCLLENVPCGGCLTFASGMAASSGLLLSKLSPGDHVVMCDVNYAGTAELARATLRRMGMQVSLVDTSDEKQIEKAVTKDTKMLWIETPCNPIVRVTDIARASSRVKDATNGRASVVVDSTFATPIATKPLHLGADYVVHSLTKYISGHGDCLGGAVIARNASDMQDVWAEAGVHYGGTMSPFNAWLTMRGASTLSLRMQQHQKNGIKVSDFLESHPKVSAVFYPGLESHPQHEIARRQMDNFSGMLGFRLSSEFKGKEAAEKMIQGLRVIKYAVSLGHHRSLIWFMPTEDLMQSSFELDGEQLQSYKRFAGDDGIFRLSLGLEDDEDIVEDLQSVLDDL